MSQNYTMDSSTTLSNTTSNSKNASLSANAAAALAHQLATASLMESNTSNFVEMDIIGDEVSKKLKLLDDTIGTKTNILLPTLKVKKCVISVIVCILMSMILLKCFFLWNFIIGNASW